MKKLAILLLIIILGIVIAFLGWGFLIFHNVEKLKDIATNTKVLDEQTYENFFNQLEIIKKDISPLKPLINRRPALKQQYELLDKFLATKEITKNLLGIDQEKTYLVVMQNNTELRPSGGFWGTYGILKIKNGKIISFITKDSHKLDLANIGKFPAPKEVADVFEDQWRFWNANWSPDFKVSVEQGLFFYSQVDPQQKFDGVIGPNLDYLLDLLQITGPIEVPAHNFKVDENNFITKLIYEPADPSITNSEKDNPDYIVGAEVKKPLLGELAERILSKIMALKKPEDILKIAQKTFHALDNQDLIFYFTDSHLEENVKENNWAGELKTNTNFAKAVDANLGSKLDLHIDKSIEYESVGNGIFKATLKYKNNFDPEKDKQNQAFSTYRTLTRIFVPKGASLISAHGGQMASEMIENKQTDSSFITSMIILEPKEEETLVFSWKVPNPIANQDLKIYKQSGSHAKIKSLTK